MSTGQREIHELGSKLLSTFIVQSLGCGFIVRLVCHSLSVLDSAMALIFQGLNKSDFKLVPP